MRTVLFVCVSLFAFSSHAVERKSILDVDVNALTTETQVMAGEANTVDIAWWIPVEFWEANLRQSEDVPASQVTDMLNVLKEHSVLAIVQADVSAFGAFTFFDRDDVAAGMVVEEIDANRKVRRISHTEPTGPDMQLLLDQMRPILAQAMGNMGQNFHFFPLPAFDDEGERILSPYDSGRLRLTLGRDGADSIMQIELPIDALFVPRTCPNGKPAHVSWDFCPWSGRPLEE